ncbi:MAG: pantetheine-phosphate adenylyltransferase [Candidatus Coproplasma sp.]
MDKKICVFAGSFDPPTVGHLAVVEKSLKIFDGVTVALMINPAKTCLFTEEERLQLLEELFADNPKVKVIKFEGCAVDLLEREQTPFYVRGVRDSIDFEYENRDNFASKKLKEDLITIYLPAEQEELHVSSSLVRNSIKFKKDYERYIPEKILKTLKKFLEKKDV